jgi:hypothetical protein
MAMPKIGIVALNRNFGDFGAVSVIKEGSHFGRYKSRCLVEKRRGQQPAGVWQFTLPSLGGLYRKYFNDLTEICVSKHIAGPKSIISSDRPFCCGALYLGLSLRDLEEKMEERNTVRSFDCAWMGFALLCAIA